MLHIDIETYSDIDIMSDGAYKYCEDESFEILLFAYAFNNEPVRIVDFTAFEELPKRVVDALENPSIKKAAHNAAFERTALKRIGFNIPIDQWECTAIKAAYCGLPLALADVSKALKFGEDKAKLSTGKALIKFFCSPTKPTKRKVSTRNYPEDAPEKWEAFKEYCCQDVEAERAIHQHLVNYSLPPTEVAMYNLDQEINDRGIGIDLQFAINDWWISDYTAFFSESKAMISIRSVHKSTILRVSRKNMEDLYEKIPQVAHFNRIKLEKAYSALQKRILANLSMTAKERYISFINSYPNIEQSVQNYHIASFLGITTESLSRIRKELT